MRPSSKAIIVALGSNLPYGGRSRLQSLCRALDAMPGHGIRVLDRSSWYRSRPVPTADQPDYINGAAVVETHLDPDGLLQQLHAIERAFGRRRRIRDEARTIDLDLIAYGDVVRQPSNGGLVLPHPRAHLRAFVLLPMRDVVPDWRHPITGETLEQLIEQLPQPHGVAPL